MGAGSSVESCYTDDEIDNEKVDIPCCNDSSQEDRPSFQTFLSKFAIADLKEDLMEVIRDDEGKRAFEKFLKNQFPERFKDTDLIQKIFDIVDADSSNQDEISQFKSPEAIKTKIHNLKNKKDYCFKMDAYHMVLTEQMLYLKAWPSFLLSKEYETWDNSTSNSQIQTVLLLADKRDRRRRSTKWNIEYISRARKSLSQRFDEDFKEISKNQPWSVDLLPLSIPRKELKTLENDISNSMIQLADKHERQSTKSNIGFSKTQKGLIKRAHEDYKEISKNQPWVIDLLQSVEGLPICVSIATANKDQHGFPLIYVNENFERITGYNREEVLGRNSRFLQTVYSRLDY